nr:MAG TPA: hypothetical protein [Caudoviricetes sp.]
MRAGHPGCGQRRRVMGYIRVVCVMSPRIDLASRAGYS